MSTSEFSGLRGRFFAWFLTSPLRRVLEWRMGKPEARLLEHLALEGHEQVLDAGCGSGFHTLLIAERLTTGSVVATDVSTEMLDRLRTLAGARGLTGRIEPRLADNLALDLDDACMDRVLSVAVWHHLNDPQKACDELARTLRPGGRVVVVDLEVVASEKAVPGLDGHDKAFGPQDMRRIFTAAGLTSIEVDKVGRWVVGLGHKAPELA